MVVVGIKISALEGNPKVKNMDYRLHLKAPWEDVKERLKENDITLTDEDLDFEPGNEHQLIRRLSEKMNKSHEEVKAYIESISSNADKAG